MKRKDITYRITKIGKTAVSVAVCGFLASLPTVTLADTDNLTGPSSITKAADTNSVGIYYDNGNFVADTPAIPVTITLNSGVDLGGQTVIGAVPFAVWTFASGNDNYYFSNQSSILNLQGNNQITGLVGVHTQGGANSPDPLSLINLNGTDVTFNNAVYANQISLTQGGAVQFYGSVSSTVPVSLDYNGHNASVTLHNGVTLAGSITNTARNGSLIFTGSGTVTGNVASGNTTPGLGSAIGLIEVRGNGSLVSVSGSVSTDLLDYQAASTVAIGQSLYLNADVSGAAVNAVRLNNTNGVLQIGSNLLGIQDKAAVTTTLNNTGTVTMVSGSQTVVGNLGAAGFALGTVNIGGANSGVGLDTSDNVASDTTVTGHVVAQTIRLNHNDPGADSSLTMASGYGITGDVVTELAGRGRLTMAGGAQTVAGNVGATGGALQTVESGANGGNTTFTGTVAATNVSNTGTGTSTFQGAVTATTVNVAGGTSNFVQGLTAGTTNIGAGTGNFNTNGSSTTASNIVFTGGAGTANLNNGLTGTINFGGQANATVNLADGKTITGAVSTTAANTGVLNALGGGTLGSNIGSGNAIKTLNVNTTAGASRTVVANGDVSAQAVNLQNDGVLQMAAGRNLTGAVTTTTANTGSLVFDGTSTVTGPVGAGALPLKTISAGVTGQTVTFGSGVAYAQTLAFSGNGTVVVNGSSPTAGSTSDLGFVGTVDFGTNGSSSGTLTLGDNVDLITENASAASNTRTAFRDANGASLRFAGTSTVTGDLGTSGNASNQNLGSVYAGANGETVTFNGKVHVSSSTFYVSGTGTVNFNDDLYGPLVYSAAGTVNVADGKSIRPSVDQTAGGGVSTSSNNTGVLNFLGSTTTNVSVASSATNRLNQVNFHSDAAIANATVNIGHDVYAQTTSVGNGTGSTTANITATGKFLGNSLTLSNHTTLNTAGAIDTAAAISPVDFAHTKITNGTLAPTALVTQSSIGTGALTTNNATLNFLVGTQAWTSGGGGLIDPAASSKITGAAGSSLNLGAGSTVNVGLLGSMRDGQSVTLIDVASGNTSLPGTYRFNSFVMDTVLTRSSGDLVMTVSRDNNTYVSKSQTAGHLSNPAAVRLGTLAAAGTGYGQDMQTVLNMLDVDQWGFGNTQSNLSTQVQRLAPVANNSVALSSLAMGSMASDSIGLRMHELRNTPQRKPYESVSFWIKSNYQSGKQEAVGQYDGYKSKLSGATLGVDSRPNNNSLAGAALSYSTGTVSQAQFRDGEKTNLRAWQFSLYGAYDITPQVFVSGVVSAGQQDANGNRATVVGRTALFDIEGKQSGYKFDLGYRFNVPNTSAVLTPMLSLEGRRLRQDAYTETNAGDVGLRVDAQDFSSQQAGLGLRLSSTHYVGGLVIKPELMASSMRERGTLPSTVNASFIGDSTAQASFATDLATSSKRLTKVSLGVGVLMSKTSSLMARYQHLKRSTFSSGTAELLARWDF